MRLQVKVQPRAGANEIVGFWDGVLHLRVTAAPEKGKANEAVVALLSKALHVPKSAIRVVKGETARTKLLEVDGLSDEALGDRFKSA